ncbi:hypothetical protein JOB18_006843 [Solea senegalensis]|uniref:Uncharacterized protein n=1 Tax=Solea senegalensis TaxID=28829 RepID=A0AAV6SYB3_SOLSE|nr:hypothetical protein JOB18_006843 [Solea senegalensis]
MDRITGDSSSTETSAPLLTTVRVPASQTCDQSRPLLFLLPLRTEVSLRYFCVNRGDHEEPGCPPLSQAVSASLPPSTAQAAEKEREGETYRERESERAVVAPGSAE